MSETDAQGVLPEPEPFTEQTTPPLLASYQTRIHLRQRESDKPMTIEELNAALGALLDDLGYHVSITSERLDI